MTQARPLESTIVAKIMAALRKRGAYVVKTHGAAMQARGLPDLIVCYRGLFIGLEAKRPGGTATALQLYTLKEMTDAGGLTAVVQSVEEALNVLSNADVLIQGGRGDANTGE